MTYMQPSRKVCALSFMPDKRLAYERIISEARDILYILEKRFFTFTQQQFMFVKALDNCRQINFEPHRIINSLTQVAHYTKNISNKTTDKRILKMFLVLVKDLQEFRRTLTKLSKQPDEKLEDILSRWKRLLEPTLDLTNLRAKYPNTQLNHLSVDERKNHFGGIVSVLPMAMDCAKQALHRIELMRVYRPARTMRRYPKDDLIAPKTKPVRPCMLQENPHPGFHHCKRVPSPVSFMSSPVSSDISVRKIYSEELTPRQIHDCKTHRVMTEGTHPQQRRNTTCGTPAWEMNKCLWRNKTCSEEFVDKMLSEKRKRDRKSQHCKY